MAVAGGTARPTSAASSVGTIATPRQPTVMAALRKGHGRETRLAYLGIFNQNRYGLVVRVATTERSGGGIGGGARHDGRPCGRHRIKVGGDRGCDVESFAVGLRRWGHAAPRPIRYASKRPAPPLLHRPPHPPVTRVRIASAGANWSRKPSPGSRPSPVRRRPGSGNSSGRLVIPARGGRLQPNGNQVARLASCRAW